MRLKIILPFIILLSFFAVLILPTSWSLCIPDGCNFRQPVCSNDSRINETVGQHIGERTSFFNAIVKFQQFFAAIALLFLFIVFQNLLPNLKNLPAGQLVMYRLDSSPETKLFNFLILFFSDGILNPKIF
ncbi:MAG: hypothetical protein AB1465_05145 [Patescibacteria group bacterium]